MTDRRNKIISNCYVIGSFWKGAVLLPQRRTAIKSLRINRSRHLLNLDIKTDLKKTIKKFQNLIAQKNIDEAKSTLRLVYKKIDKAAKNRILHKNTAARRKSRFSRLLQTISKN